MAQVYITGPVDVWASNPDIGGFDFLGHSEKSIRPEYSPYYQDIKCDLTGDAPLDRMFTGETARVSMDLIRYNDYAIRYRQVYTQSALFNDIVPGFKDPGRIGMALILEGAAPQLLFRFPYASKPSMANALNGALPAGIRFMAAFLDPNSVEFGSTMPRKVHLAFTCLPVLDVTVQNSYGAGRLTLYDNNVSGLPVGFS